MSAPLVGKFQDHYAVLGIDPKADTEAIQKAYTKLAQRYHAKNAETGDPEMFEAVNMAYETLSDPELRATFDRLKGVNGPAGVPKFSGAGFFDALGREAARRLAVLCVLYDRRLTSPMTPSLSMRHLESIVEATASELGSAIWYLKQRGLAASDDKSSLQITVDGMDFLEARKPPAEDVMPYIKSAAQTEAKLAQEPVSVLSKLNRALARGAEKQTEVAR
ncbi:MAG TPA: DnaJ domain-containing protein [Bryobacteraceae bacterium]|nr:DnaJ domain-containing protein [Bryobacteraceae bacterium]